MTIERLIRVLSIRSDNPLGKGGCIFYGVAIDEAGTALGDEHFVVVAPFHLLSAIEVEIGQWWRVSGDASAYTSLRNGYQIKEQQIDPLEMRLLLPSGQHIVTLLANGKHFSGVGISKATRLWQRFGEELQELLETGQKHLLASVQGISLDTADQLIEGWKLYDHSSVLHLLGRYGIDYNAAQMVLEHFENNTLDALSEDPYRLLSFSASWKSVDLIALKHFDLALEDPRRTNGAVEEVLYRLFSEGHTAPPKPLVLRRLGILLNGSSTSLRTLSHSSLSFVLEHSLEHGVCLALDEGERVQQVGAWAMEKKVAEFIADRLPSVATNRGSTDDLFRQDCQVIDRILDHQPSSIQLTVEQQAAVQTVATQRVGLISGGAGVGKTTVLKTLYAYFDAIGLPVIQVAIAGRAAQRMREATGRPARTLASLLYSRNQGELDEPFVLVIDEASMVDILTMYRLCHVLPEHANLLMVGDTGQLMPVGPGLVFHNLAQDHRIPHARLTQVMRHGSSIASVSASIRGGEWPEMGSNDVDAVAFLRPTTGSSTTESPLQTSDHILRLYLRSPESTQILCAHKNGPLGVRALNKLCQDTVGIYQPRLQVWNAEFQMFADTGFRLGDPIVCMKNLKEMGLQNGSLGRITSLEEPSAQQSKTDRLGEVTVLAWAAWDDGARRPITSDLLQNLNLAYALTIHKAQGSEWPIVIVPIVRSRLLDRSLIYTAITRAQKQVLLMGDEPAAKAAVARSSRASQRSSGLSYHLAEQLDEIAPQLPA
ncbi:ATP-dependent RecD-like DNA helicase [Pseudomonas koreensis]|nr:ATP-dependent RecD-like DNA helicase [Pseudomonas koreensis]